MFDTADLFVPDYVDTTGWTAEQFRDERRRNKASVTKKIKLIEKTVRNRESRSVDRLLKKQLQEKVETCSYWHQRFVSPPELSEMETQRETAWLEAWHPARRFETLRRIGVGTCISKVTEATSPIDGIVFFHILINT